MKDKICVVTGGNAGIGKATVAGLAQRGATVVIACRDVSKGKAALDEIAAKTGASELHVMRLDLASLESVRSFATQFTARFTRLDASATRRAPVGSPMPRTAPGARTS